MKRGETPPQHYTRWLDMRRRCLSPVNKAWPSYGGRGITICEEWLVFNVFKKWCDATYIPGRTLNRIDNCGPYSPSNCNWATKKEQASNRRQTEKVVLVHFKRIKAAQKKRHLIFGNPRTRKKKKCPDCTQILSLIFFSRRKHTPDFREAYCIECYRKRDKEKKYKQRHGHTRDVPCSCARPIPR